MKTIKITLMMVMMVLSISITSAATMGISSVREKTRFLTDKMAYELGLNDSQIDDVYEVNYDFVNNVRPFMDEVVSGDRYAIDRYYDFLDNRNDDLRWILSDGQYRRFMDIEYFNKPLYTYSSGWSFRVFNHYVNISHYYYPRPTHYYSYCGGHYRSHYNNISFYKVHCTNRYGRINFYHKPFSVRPNHYNKPNVIIPGHHTKPIVVPPTHRPSTRPVVVPPTHRPSVRPVEVVRPEKHDKRYDGPKHVTINRTTVVNRNKIDKDRRDNSRDRKNESRNEVRSSRERIR